MSRQSTLLPEGKWYKGNTHAHTNISDAHMSPPELVREYRRLGYDFTAITDHRIYGIHEDLCSSNFLILPGVELDVAVQGPEAFCHHVVGLGIPGENRFVHGQRIAYAPEATVADIISILRENGNFCLYAHPAWSHVRYDQLDTLEGILGIEIYNHGCEVGNACGDSDSWYNHLLWQGKRLWAVASDDTHQHRLDYGGGFVMAKARDLTWDSIVGALLSGSFYASQGPLIEDFYVDDGFARLKCSPCRSIGFLADSVPGSTFLTAEPLVTEGSYKLKGSEAYVRAICTDSTGLRAWSQPIWLDGRPTFGT